MNWKYIGLQVPGSRRLGPYYFALEHNPQMKFDQFLVNFGGLLGLWHGLSLLHLKNYLIDLINILFSKYYGMREFHRFFTNFKKLKILRTFSMKRLELNLNFLIF
jgi:hypothetical protein